MHAKQGGAKNEHDYKVVALVHVDTCSFLRLFATVPASNPESSLQLASPTMPPREVPDIIMFFNKKTK